MPARDTAPTGGALLGDLLTDDAARSRDFYGQLFGWTSTEPQEEFGGYFNFSRIGVLFAACTAQAARHGSAADVVGLPRHR